MRRIILFLTALAGLTLGSPMQAADFPPITTQERALTAMPGEPNAPAVVLFRKSEFLMMGYGTQGRVSSSLLVKARTKVLTEEGKSRGEVSIAHSSFVRLLGFQGRTVLPDGQILPLPSDAKFERKLSKRQKRSVTSVAFPGVQVGAILDYQFELRFDSMFYLEPWYFADELPVVYSEVIFKIPPEVKAAAWRSDPLQVGFHTESQQTADGTKVRVWAENVPSVPDEPFSVPFADLAMQMLLVPISIDDGVEHVSLLESWASVCKLFDDYYYQKAQRKEGDSVKKAREIAGRAGAGARQKAEAIYRFVRDEIANENLPGVELEDGSSVGKTLAGKRGDSAEKSLLLHTMLGAAQIKARLVWAGNRWRGEIDPQVANPAWFDRILVAAEIDGRRVFLDPSDPSLAFGQLQYAYEGTPAVVHDRKKPETIVLPETPFDQNGRRVVVDLTLDEAGALSGTGELVLTGHHAWDRIDWQDDDARTLEAWQEWLADGYEDFAVSDVKFEERPDDRTVQLTWKLAQREEDVLGDETSLEPSRPLGPVSQPFVQDRRRSPVLFSYPDREEVELRLHWPEGWRVDAVPTLIKQEQPVGTFLVEVEEKGAERTLVYRRRFEMRHRKVGSTQHYEAVRALYAAVEKSDAQPLALVRR